MNKDYKSLELDKILEMLAGETSFFDAAELARNLTPATTLREVTRLIEDTDAAWVLLSKFSSPSFGRLKNIDGSLGRAKNGAVLSMRELLDVVETLRIIRSLNQWRKQAGGIETCLDDRFYVLSPNKYLEDKISNSIISEEEIADNASPELSRIRRKISNSSNKIRENLNKMIHSATYQKYLQDPVITMRSGRFVVPVKTECRGNVPGLVHDSSASGATVFVEPMSVVETNNELRMLGLEENKEIERILAELSAEVGDVSDSMGADFEILVELCLIFAKANLAYKMKSVKPKLTDNGTVRLNKARHPLIPKDAVVPISVELGFDFDTLVITGPNTGGKTVTLKTIGLLTLMTMCGLFPPAADNTVISIFDKILVDIGDEQSIEQSLSTFSAHMTNIVRILNSADDNSLVLIDELGAGTDPVEGAALAIAILENLQGKEAIVACTTHYAELKAFAIRTEGVENGSCEFDVATLRPTYKLLVGVPGRSNAFAISKRLGMDDYIVEQAKSYVSGDQQNLEQVILSLDEQRQSLEKELSATKSIRSQSEQRKIEAEKELKDIEKTRDAEIENAKEQARKIVENARLEAEIMMEELDKIRKAQRSDGFSGNEAAMAKSQLRSQLKELDKAVHHKSEKKKSIYKLARPLQIGDSVTIADIDKKATVVALPDNKGIVTVHAGILTTKVHVDNLRLINESSTSYPGQNQPKNGVSSNISRAGRSVKTEIDLRGMNSEEAILELDRFIDDNLISGLELVTIIHGKGTGVLRTSIQRHLRSHSAIKKFRTGSFGEGEDGVTIATLK